MGLAAFAVSTELDIKLNELASKVFPLLNIDFDQWWYVGLTLAVATWLWIVPLLVFLVNIFRKSCLAACERKHAQTKGGRNACAKNLTFSEES